MESLLKCEFSLVEAYSVFAYNAQRWLSKGQIVPIIGGIFISPIKILIGGTQMFVGCSVFVLNLPLKCITNGKSREIVSDTSSMGLITASLGGASVIYGIINMFTFSLFGKKLERFFREFS